MNLIIAILKYVPATGEEKKSIDPEKQLKNQSSPKLVNIPTLALFDGSENKRLNLKLSDCKWVFKAACVVQSISIEA